MMPPGQPSGTEPADQAVALFQRTRELLLECRAVAERLQTAPGA
jgi:hypothetical protein